MWVRSLGQEDPLGARHGNPLQYSCLGNPMDRVVHRIAKNQSRLKQLSMHVCVCVCIYIYIYIHNSLPTSPWGSPLYDMLLISGCFQEFSITFHFQLITTCLGIISILFILFVVY